MALYLDGDLDFLTTLVCVSAPTKGLECLATTLDLAVVARTGDE